MKKFNIKSLFQIVSLFLAIASFSFAQGVELQAPLKAYPWLSEDGNSIYAMTQNKSGSYEILYKRWDSKKKSYAEESHLKIPLFIQMRGFWFNKEESKLIILDRQGRLFLLHRLNGNEFGKPTELKLHRKSRGTLLNPSFTQDMTQLFFFEDVGEGKILRFDLDSNNTYEESQRIILPENWKIMSGRLDASGKHFVFSRAIQGSHQAIVKMSRKSQSEDFENLKLLYKTKGHAVQPFWSEKSQQLIFIENEGLNGRNNYIQLLDLDDEEVESSQTQKKVLSQEFDFSLSPNPASYLLTFSWSFHKDNALEHIRIHNSQGILMLERKLSLGQNLLKLSVEEWPKGLYIASFWNEKQMLSKKKFMVLP